MCRVLCPYLLRVVGEQELMVLEGGQQACRGADVERLVCGQVVLDAGGVWCLPREQGLQVGLHDLPVERQLQVT